MRCSFAVSSWFVERASSTVNIDLSDVTNKYYTVLYRPVVVYEKKNRSLVFSGSRKIPTLGSTVQWELGKPRFPLERWALGLEFFCPHWTPMMDSIYPNLTRIMNSFSCLPIYTSFILEKLEKDFKKILNKPRCDMVTSFKHYNDVTDRRAASVWLFVFIFLWGWYGRVK